MFRILVLLLSNHWFSQYYAKWFKRKRNGLKIAANGLELAKSSRRISNYGVINALYLP
jgi:hypothetical protein